MVGDEADFWTFDTTPDGRESVGDGDTDFSGDGCLPKFWRDIGDGESGGGVTGAISASPMTRERFSSCSSFLVMFFFSSVDNLGTEDLLIYPGWMVVGLRTADCEA